MVGKFHEPDLKTAGFGARVMPLMVKTAPADGFGTKFLLDSK
jgi:hypothetical protein